MWGPLTSLQGLAPTTKDPPVDKAIFLNKKITLLCCYVAGWCGCSVQLLLFQTHNNKLPVPEDGQR